MAGIRAGFDKEKALAEKLSAAGIKEQDIIENFVRSSGPGGQNVNKVSTCVYLKHIPTGIEVKCQRERSQASNRYAARQILLEKILALKRGRLLAVRHSREKLKRQKRRKPVKIKLRILEDKRRQSEKKRFRRSSVNNDYE